MAKVGSTAPIITSPLLAWPARPAARSSPASAPTTPVFGSQGFSDVYAQNNASSATFGPIPTTSTIIEPASIHQPDGAKLPSTTGSKGKERAEIVEGGHQRMNPDRMDAQGLGSQGILLEDEDQDGHPAKAYAPPTKPLSPQQLGRIAQSFGIAIPSLATSSYQLFTPPRSHSSTPISPGSRHDTGISRSGSGPGSLVTVIPPLSLLPPSTSEEAGERLKAWRRGRLIPLQPTLGLMLLAIAREFGLPSTNGIGIYLASPSAVQTHTSISSSSSFSSGSTTSASAPAFDAPVELGPRLSSHTWAAAFSSQASRSSTPSSSPYQQPSHRFPKSHFPPSPISIASRNTGSGFRSISAQPTPTKPSFPNTSDPYPLHHPASPARSARLPPPSSPIIGAIEFDVDPYEATWFPEYVQQGASRHRRTKSASESFAHGKGIKELSLIKRKGDARPRFLKDLDVNQANSHSSSRQRKVQQVHHRLNSSDGAEHSDKSTGFPQVPHTFSARGSSSTTMSDADADIYNSGPGMFSLRDPPSTSRRYSVREVEVEHGYEPLSASASLSFTGLSSSASDLRTPGADDEDQHEDEEGDSRLLNMDEEDTEHEHGTRGLNEIEEEDGPLSLLAPFNIKDELARSPRFAEPGADKRGSGVMMSEQLDDLEKIMRQLSPREIRLTSPRMMTPRTANKVASLNIQQAPQQRSAPAQPGAPSPIRDLAAKRSVVRPAKSPLVNGFTDTYSPPVSPSAMTSSTAFPRNPKSAVSGSGDDGVSSILDSRQAESRPSLASQNTDSSLGSIATTSSYQSATSGSGTSSRSINTNDHRNGNGNENGNGNAVWPAVPISKLSTSPGSPALEEYFAKSPRYARAQAKAQAQAQAQSQTQNRNQNQSQNQSGSPLHYHPGKSPVSPSTRTLVRNSPSAALDVTPRFTSLSTFEHAQPHAQAYGSNYPAQGLSAETQKRMESLHSTPKSPISTEWRPPRPARPPSPNLYVSNKLGNQTAIGHIPLSPNAQHGESAESSVSGGMHAQPLSPAWEEEAGPSADIAREDQSSPKGKSKVIASGGRSGSVRLRGLRAQMSAKTLNISWRKDDKDKDKDKEKDKANDKAKHQGNSEAEPMPDLPMTTASSLIPREPVGLFGASIPLEASGSTSSFPGLDPRNSSQVQISEFGTIHEDEQGQRLTDDHAVLPSPPPSAKSISTGTSSLPSGVGRVPSGGGGGGGMRKMFGGSFTFGRRVSSDTHAHAHVQATTPSTSGSMMPPPPVIASGQSHTLPRGTSEYTHAATSTGPSGISHAYSLSRDKDNNNTREKEKEGRGSTSISWNRRNHSQDHTHMTGAGRRSISSPIFESFAHVGGIGSPSTGSNHGSSPNPNPNPNVNANFTQGWTPGFNTYPNPNLMPNPDTSRAATSNFTGQPTNVVVNPIPNPNPAGPGSVTVAQHRPSLSQSRAHTFGAAPNPPPYSHTHPALGPYNPTPASPTSPRSIRRKPVPGTGTGTGAGSGVTSGSGSGSGSGIPEGSAIGMGMPLRDNSVSLGSMAGLVLDGEDRVR